MPLGLPVLAVGRGYLTDQRQVMERARGVEPRPVAWKAPILPLYDAREWLMVEGSNLHLLGQSQVSCH